jgi:hypothetical protein
LLPEMILGCDQLRPPSSLQAITIGEASVRLTLPTKPVQVT